MSKIRILSKETADRIAAGEVIEEPLSVVKELVENSIDAEASQIIVEIRNGGKDYIRVTDNGIGMDWEDLRLSVLPHATSKIRFAEDLSNISSLGFRGEALASIFAVSRMELISKTSGDKNGYRISSGDSENTETGPCASDAGTTIIVKDLFYNLPARRSFLRSDNKEASSISEFLQRIALAYTNIKFRFINNGSIVFSTPGKGDLYQTILTLFSPKDARKLLKIEYTDNILSIRGYISSPLESRNNRKNQIFFVNGRLIRSAVLERAVSEAYRDKLFEGRFPSVYLFIEISPSDIDVNIHPRKLEIRFLNEQAVSDALVKAVRNALYDKDSLSLDEKDIKKSNLSSCANGSSENTYNDINIIMSTDNNTDIFCKLRAADEVIESNSPISAQNIYELHKHNGINENNVQEEINPYSSDGKKFIFSGLVPLGQVFTTYILASDGNNLYILDQHAAHERIMFEKLLKNFNSEQIDRQIMLLPIIEDLTPSQMLYSRDMLSLLEKLGFVMEEFGSSSYLIKEIPMCFSDNEAEAFLSEFFNSAEEYRSNIQLKRNAIISRACKSAVKAHDKLSFSEMNVLFKQLDACDNPFSCPHGRPTFLKLSESELERMFKRK